MYKKFIKRIFDIIFTVVMICLLLPIFLLIFILNILFLRSNPIYIQERVGLHAKIFKIYKFKSMTDRKDSFGNLLPDEQRTIWFGNILRKFSLDELPQLFNILIGDMSLIGPRPLLPRYLPLYNKFQSRRHEVKPGLTGLAQVKGRNTTDWNTRFTYDIYYVDNMSFLLDLRIFISTTFKVLIFKNITPKDKLFMEEFLGN